MKQQQQDMKNSILSQFLTQEARARLNTLALTKPEKAQMVENHLVQMAQLIGYLLYSEDMLLDDLVSLTGRNVHLFVD